MSDAPERAVCIVEDDPSLRKALTRLIESAGLEVHTFGEPEAFLEHLATHQVPVAVLDICTNHMTGLELVAHLCARSPQTRVIFISGREDQAARTTVMQAGVFAFFVKPFDDAELVAAIRGAVAEANVPSKEKV